jgi:hypothetical protein
MNTTPSVVRFYRIKKGATIDPQQPLSTDQLDEISESEFFLYAGETVCYGATKEEFRAILRRNKKELYAA